jgi:phosphate transport system substrate-binding protein
VSGTVLLVVTAAVSVARSQTAAPKAEDTEAMVGPKTMVEWLLPALPTYPLPTDKDRAVFYVSGREEPTPELLQPQLDPALPAYRPRTDVKLSGSFRGRTRETFPRQVALWIAEFKKYYPDVNIEVPPPYGGEIGAKQIIKGEVDFIIITRELRPEDYSDFKAAFGNYPLVVPMCGGTWRHVGFTDAEAFFVNKANPLERISLEQLDAIFSTTRHRGGKPITTWGQLGLSGDWADKPIHLYGVKPWNGFEEFPRQRVLSRDGQRGEWRDDITWDQVGVTQAGPLGQSAFLNTRRVAADRYGIGYTGLSGVDAGVRLLPLGESENGPFQAPTYENVTLARYPLSRLIYFCTGQVPGKPLDPALEEFVRFILSKEGQQIVLNHGIYLPLRSEQVSDFRAILSGTSRRSRFFLNEPYNVNDSKKGTE